MATPAATMFYYSTKPRAVPVPGTKVTGNGVASWPVPMALAASATSRAGALAMPYKTIWCATLGKVLAGGANGTMQAGPSVPATAQAYTPACGVQAWACAMHPASGLTSVMQAALQAWATTHAPALLVAPSAKATG